MWIHHFNFSFIFEISFPFIKDHISTNMKLIRKWIMTSISLTFFWISNENTSYIFSIQLLPLLTMNINKTCRPKYLKMRNIRLSIKPSFIMSRIFYHLYRTSVENIYGWMDYICPKHVWKTHFSQHASSHFYHCYVFSLCYSIFLRSVSSV